MTLEDRMTVLDAARLHFKHAADSPKYTREARQLSREWERKVEAELTAFKAELDRVTAYWAVREAGVGE